jgi:peptidoglycan/LPS O-acetylase OafA/YrhL
MVASDGRAVAAQGVAPAFESHVNRSQEIDLSRNDSPRLKRNNFDLLRLSFAGTVCLVHAYELSGFGQLSVIADALSSLVAVKGFFVVSGFLIFMSFERSASLASYAKKRVRRIYPAYFSVVMLCAMGLVVVSSQSAGEYFFSRAWARYVPANLAFLNFVQPTLPGVFEANRMATVNGALWTLKVEVMFYVAVPAFVWLFRKFGHLRMLVLFYCSSIAYTELMAFAAARSGLPIYLELGRQLPGQLSYFLSGALLYYFLPFFERRVRILLPAAAVALWANNFVPLPVFEPVSLAIVVVFFGLFLHLGNFGKHGDFSYGVYIVHFPIIQLLLNTRWLDENPWLFLLTVILLTAVGGAAMWHLVEKRFLSRSSHYIAAVSASEPAGRPGL